MSSSVVLTTSVVVANVCGAGMIVPQVVRLHRLGDPSGVSTGWTGVGIALNLWWLIYASVEQLWGLLPVSAGALVLYAVMAFQLHALAASPPKAGGGSRPGRSPLYGVARGVLPMLALPMLALVLGRWTAVALVLGLAYSVQFLPALAGVAASADPGGVSAATWLMALVEATVWLTYGAVVGDLALMVGGSGGALSAGLILLVLFIRLNSPAPVTGAEVRSRLRLRTPTA